MSKPYLGSRLGKYGSSESPGDNWNSILVPGELEFREEEKKLKNGIPLSEATWTRIQELAESLGVNLDAFVSF